MQNMQQEKSSRSTGTVLSDVIWGLFLSFAALVVMFGILGIMSSPFDTLNFNFIHLSVATIFTGVSFGFLYAWRHSERKLTARLFYYIVGLFLWPIFVLGLTAIVADTLVSFGSESNIYGGANKAAGFWVFGWILGLALSPLYLWILVFLERKILQLPFSLSRVLFLVASLPLLLFCFFLAFLIIS